MSRKLELKFTSKSNIKLNELNQILDKISINQGLSEREMSFLQDYEEIDESELKDYNFLSLMDLFYIICKIKKEIICDIKDKFGKINQQIKSVEYLHDEYKIILGLKHGTFSLTDNFLYKLTYEFKHDNYSLDIENEYYEKIKLDNGN